MSEEDKPLVKKEILLDFNELNQEISGVKNEISSDYEEWNKETSLDRKEIKNVKNEISVASDGLLKNSLTTSKGLIKDEPGANQCEKKKKLYVTSEQRECIVRFMIENPELITHSSTQNSELKLWKELITELNALKPEKEFKCWRDYWRRWLRAIEMKTKINLTPTDSKLNQYLNQIRKIEKKTKRKITAKEINDQLNKIEERKMQLNFELDELNYTVLIYKSTLEDTEKKIKELNKTKAQLTIAKRYLHYRKRLIEEENNNTCDAQLCVIKKENSFLDQTK